MIGIAGKVRVWARSQPTDLRKGYAGLAGLVERALGGHLLSGDLFVFISKRRTSLDLLHWDGTGICIYSKRLGRGQFAAVWERQEGGEIRLTWADLVLFLEGVKPSKMPPKKSLK